MISFVDSAEGILLLTAIVIGIELFVFAILLIRERLFQWTKAGFWAWIAFLLYYVLTPLSVYLTDDIHQFNVRLAISDGFGRGLWILFNAFVGILIYFLFYIRTKDKVITWGLTKSVYRLTVPSFTILIMCFSFGLYSMLTFRSGLLSNSSELVISNGRFTGEITGYQYAGYVFLLVPSILLLFSPGWRERALGWGLCIVFIILSLPDAWARFITVSMILVLSIVDTLQRKTRWRRILILMILIVSAALFQTRGHVEWEITDIDKQMLSLLGEFPDQFTSILTENDTAMLASWYLDSYLHDRWIGYDYGIPLTNYILFGFIPGRIFPQKYFLVDMLRSAQGKSYPIIIDQLLYGAKSSLIGDFYANGGLIGVLLGVAIAGYLSRRLDGMLLEDAPTLVKAVGTAWLSLLWIVWGSGSFWGFTVYGNIAIPALGLWLVDRLSNYGEKPLKISELNS